MSENIPDGMPWLEELNPEQQERIAEILKESKRSIDEHLERQRTEPHRFFVEAAIIAGPDGMPWLKELNPEQQERIAEILKESKRSIDEHLERQRTEPHRFFVEAAIIAGPDGMPWLKELNPEQQERIAEILKESKRSIDEHLERQRTEPHRFFVEAAIIAGFTRAQAEFLWINRPRPEWRA